MANNEGSKKEDTKKVPPKAGSKGQTSGIGDDLNQVRTVLSDRAKDFNAILNKMQLQNEELVQSIATRIKAIESSSVEQEIKKKMVNKINEYFSAILDESQDLKIKPEKARLKDLERLSTYFNVTDELLTKIENKISRTEDKSANA